MDTRRTLVAAAIALASFAASAQVTGGLGSVGSTFLSLSGVNITGGAIYGPNDNVQTATRPANASPAIGTVGNWLAVGGTNVNNGGGTSATLRLASGITAMSFLWGTPDSFNSVKVNTNAGSQTFTAATLGLTPPSNTNFAGYVNFRVSGGATSISSVEFISPSPAFEISNVSVVPEPGTAALLLGGLLAVGVVARRRRLQDGAQLAGAA